MAVDLLGEWSQMVTALVAHASDEVKHRVGIKLAAARAAFTDKYGGMSSEIRDVIGTVEPWFFDWEEAATDCPACDSRGIAKGSYWLDEAVDYDKETGEPSVWGW